MESNLYFGRVESPSKSESQPGFVWSMRSSSEDYKLVTLTLDPDVPVILYSAARDVLVEGSAGQAALVVSLPWE